MYPVGAIPRRAERLIEVTYEAMMRGISVIKPGATTGDIGAAIQSYVEAQHMSVVRDFCGHGLGRLFHDEPNIVHVGRQGEGIVLRPGMFFTVEPMINLGRPHVKVLSDGWTAVTRDRSLSAQFEHTVAVTAGPRRNLHAIPEGSRSAQIRVRACLNRATHKSWPDLGESHIAKYDFTGILRRVLGAVTRKAAAVTWPARARAANEVRVSRNKPRIITAIANGCARAFARAGPRR